MKPTPRITVKPLNTLKGQNDPFTPMSAPCIGELTSQKNDDEKNIIPNRNLGRKNYQSTADSNE